MCLEDVIMSKVKQAIAAGRDILEIKFCFSSGHNVRGTEVINLIFSALCREHFLFPFLTRIVSSIFSTENIYLVSKFLD